jgi:hypothetical protein
LAAAVHPAPIEERVVEAQPRQGEEAERGGQMKHAGLREVERAKADGRWED